VTVEMNGEVGATAWKVWLLIYNEGPQTLVELRRKVVESKRPAEFRSGVAAREDKIEIVRQRKGLRIELRKALIGRCSPPIEASRSSGTRRGLAGAERFGTRRENCNKTVTIASCLFNTPTVRFNPRMVAGRLDDLAPRRRGQEAS